MQRTKIASLRNVEHNLARRTKVQAQNWVTLALGENAADVECVFAELVLGVTNFLAAKLNLTEGVEAFKDKP